MFSADHLSLKTLRLRANEEWVSPGRGFSFLFPRKGSATYFLGPLAFGLNPGDVLVGNGEPRGRVSASGEGEVLLQLFSIAFEHLYPLFGSREIGLLGMVADSLKRSRLYQATTGVARECHRLLESAPPRLDFQHRTHLLQMAATVLYEEIEAAEARRWAAARPDEHVAEILERLTAGELLNSSVEELAQKFGFCRRHLNRLFRQCFGLSIRQLRLEMRMIKAATLLRDPSAKVINVAGECGFNNLGLFNATFKQRFDMAPGQFRNQHREPERRLGGPNLGRQLCALQKAGLCPIHGGPGANAGRPPDTAVRSVGCAGATRTSGHPARRAPNYDKRPLSICPS